MEYFDSELCVLIKKPNKPDGRPIKMCTMFRNIHDKIIAKQLRHHSEELFKDLQFINENNAADKLIKTFQATLTTSNNINIYSTMDTLSTDISNAFQNINRQTILNQMSQTFFKTFPMRI